MASGVRRLLLVDPVEHLKEYSNRLDGEMKKILRDQSISESDKLREYLIVLRRYILSKRTSTVGEQVDSGISHLTKKEPKQEEETAAAATAQLPLEIAGPSGVQPPPPPQIRATVSTAAPKIDDYSTEALLKKFAANKEKHKKVQYILSLMGHPNSWLKYHKKSGELVNANTGMTIPGSNIYDSLRHNINTDARSQGVRPPGHSEFEQFLEKVNSPYLKRTAAPISPTQTGSGSQVMKKRRRIKWVPY
jgi:hypothetical protein